MNKDETAENDTTETTDIETTDIETTETANQEVIITPDDVYTVKVSNTEDVLSVYFVALGGVIVAAALVHLMLHYVGRYRT